MSTLLHVCCMYVACMLHDVLCVFYHCTKCVCVPFMQAVRMNKEKTFKNSVERLIETSQGTPAESAPLDVHCTKPKITFGDPEKKVDHTMCLLAWCGFHCRLEFAKHLIEMGASECVMHTSHTCTSLNNIFVYIGISQNHCYKY